MAHVLVAHHALTLVGLHKYAHLQFYDMPYPVYCR